MEKEKILILIFFFDLFLLVLIYSKMVNFYGQFRGTYKEDRNKWIATEQTKDPIGKFAIFFAFYLIFDILVKKSDLEIRYIREVYYKQTIPDMK